MLWCWRAFLFISCGDTVEEAFNSPFQGWFDTLEVILERQAKLAGLLDHGVMMGNAREFFVANVLKSVLPPSLHIGTGKIIDVKGNTSKQVDVIIYDPQFPVMETSKGQGMYLVDGVIAAIEIKSTLDKQKLWDALDNCLSVGSLEVATHDQSAARRLFDNEWSVLRLNWPATYIFGFQSKTDSIKTLGDIVEDWWKQRGFTFKDMRRMPEVISAGNIIGLASGRWMQVAVDGELASKVLKSTGDNPFITFAFWKLKRRFGWMLMHLLHTCAQRFSTQNQLTLEQYLPRSTYLADLKDQLSTVLSVQRPDEEG